jgi:clan AA aspartic protease
MEAMGLFRVSAHLTGPTGRTEIVDVLVDTGATFLVVPRDLAGRLELRPTRTCPIETAGGREEAWPLAEVRIRLDGHEVTTPCLIAEEGQALLGAVALESLLLAADPVARRLVPVKGFVGELMLS